MNDTLTPTTTWLIHETNMYDLEQQVEKANKRLERHALAERFSFERIGVEKKVSENGVVDIFYEVNFNHPEIGYANKQLLGSVQIEDGGTILRMVPGMETPAGFERPDAHRCDHCNTNRQRTKSYLVLDTGTGEIKQVGSSCLSLYLGVELKGLWALGEFTAEQLAEMAEPSHTGEGGGLGDSRRYDVRWLLRLAYAVSNGGRKFVSRAKSTEWEKPATVDDVMWVIHFKRTSRTTYTELAEIERFNREAAELDEAIVDEIINEGLSLTYSDYAENLKAALQSKSVTARAAGITVSAVGAWRRTKTQRETSERMYEDLHIGKVKERLRDRRAEVKLAYESENEWGLQTLLIFRDEETGAAIKWNASSRVDVEVGDTVLLTGTVKGHGTYKGTKQTQLTRCKVQKV